MRRFILVSLMIVSLGHFSKASEWGVPQILGPNINTAAYDYMPFITADGKALYFVSDRNVLTDDDIYVSHWDSLTGDWGPAIRLNSNINTAERDMFPSLTPDGKRLYFVRWGWPGGYGQYDIWYSDWDTTINDWGVPKNAGPNINTFCMEWSACVSRDGMKLFFSSGYVEGFPTCDFQEIYVSNWDSVKGQWEKPCCTVGVVNDGIENDEPSPDASDTVVYFRSGWPYGDSNYQGAYDIFAAYFNGASWYRVENPGAPLNSADWEGKPSISADGQRMFFASRRDDSTYLTIYDNIFVAERTTAVKEKEGGVIKPSHFNLTAYPNPFNSSTTISYSLSRSINISLAIYNLLGQKVRALEEGYKTAGHHRLNWDGRNISGQIAGSGIYFCVLSAGDFKEARKLVFIK